MERLKIGPIILTILTIIAFAGTPAYGEYHHVTDCTVCHYSSDDSDECGASPNLVLIRDTINTPYSGPRETVFGPYVLGEEPYGVCEVCHTGVEGQGFTKYYRNDGLGGNHPAYRPGFMGATECGFCHRHAPDEFGHEGAAGTGCDACHGQEDGAGTAFSHATHTKIDDARGPHVGCSDCHNTNHFPNFADGATNLAATTTCDDCHSEGGGYDGVAMAKAGWEDGIYEEGGQGQMTLKSGQQAWCIGCHDKKGTVINGAEADNVAGDSSGYGYFAGGHGKYDVTCTDCHDPTLTHIDGDNRTYNAGELIDPTGPNGYQQGYRLRLVNGDPPLLIPRQDGWEGDPDDFALCFECHSENRILESVENDFVKVVAEERTAYAEHVSGKDSWHLNNPAIWWDSDRSGDGWDSNYSCPTCHDPHGKKAYDGRATWSMTRGDLGIVHQREVWRSYGYINSNAYEDPSGDLTCEHCHGIGSLLGYPFQPGTPCPDRPAFWTELDDDDSITSPRFGAGGTNQGGTFASYTRLGASETGLKVDDDDTGVSARFPANNLNGNNAIEGETIDFWYTPSFTPLYNSGEKVLFHCYYDDDNYIKIQMYNASLVFVIMSNGEQYALQGINLNLLGDWTAGTAHHVVCTWGPAFGMHMYLDKVEPEYDPSYSDTDYIGGTTQLPDYFSVGNSADGLYPAYGIIDDLKIYGYQYQRFENPITFFSKMESQDDIQTPVLGAGGNLSGSVSFSSDKVQHGTSAHFSNSNNGVVNFPTSNLNRDSDSIDFWYYPEFLTTNEKWLFYCEKEDPENKAVIRMSTDKRINFSIVKDNVLHQLTTVPLQTGDWYFIDQQWLHIVFTWGPAGMHIYVNDREAVYENENGLSYTEGFWDFGTSPGDPDEFFRIGNKGAGNAVNADGYIDEIRIYGYQADKPELEFAHDPLGWDLDLNIVSGRVGSLDGVVMTGLPGNPQTNNGFYYASVEDGWSGTVTPKKVGYTFTPDHIDYIDVTSDQILQNYEVASAEHTISGRVATTDDSPLEGVTMSGLPYNPQTDPDGLYSGTVPHGASGTVTPTKSGYRFDPEKVEYPDVDSDHVQDYEAILTHTISGHVEDMEGVTMHVVPLQPGGPVLTDSDGFYSITVDDGWSGTVTPIKEGNVFTPESREYVDVTSDYTGQYFGHPGVNLEVPLEMVDLGISSSTAATTFTRSAIRLDADDYDGATYYFEFVGSNSNGNNDYAVELIDMDNGNDSKCHETVPQGTATPTRFRTEAFIPATGNNEYQVRLAGTELDDELKVYAARIVVVQNNATKTRIQIPLSSGPFNFSSNAPDASVDDTDSITYTQRYPDHFSLWKKDESVWGDIASGTPWTLEAVFGTFKPYGGEPDGMTNLSLFKRIDDENAIQVVVTELTHGLNYGLESVDFANDADNFDDLGQFEVKYKLVPTGGFTYFSALARASLYVKLTNLNKGEVYWRLSRKASVSVAGTNALQRVLWNGNNYSHPKVYFQATGRDATLSGMTIGALDAETSDSGTSGSMVSGSEIDFTSTTKALERMTTDLIPNLINGNRYVARIDNPLWESETIVITSSALVVTFSEAP